MTRRNVDPVDAAEMINDVELKAMLVYEATARPTEDTEKIIKILKYESTVAKLKLLGELTGHTYPLPPRPIVIDGVVQ